MYERFTDRARKALQLANQAAFESGHSSVLPIHYLGGILREGSGVAANVLKNLKVDVKQLAMKAWEIIPIPPEGDSTAAYGRLPQSLGAKIVIAAALTAAERWGHNYVGTEHLLAGLFAAPETKGILGQFGLSFDGVHEAVMALLNPAKSAESPQGVPIPTGSMLARELEIRGRLLCYKAKLEHVAFASDAAYLRQYIADVEWLLERLNAPYFIMEYKPTTDEEREALQKAAEQVKGMTLTALPHTVMDTFTVDLVHAAGAEPFSSLCGDDRPNQMTTNMGRSVTCPKCKDAMLDEWLNRRALQRNARLDSLPKYGEPGYVYPATAEERDERTARYGAVAERTRILSVLDAILATQDSAARAALILLRDRIASI